MIVDAHHHLWDPGQREYPWMSGADLAPIRRRYAMDDFRAAAGSDVDGTVLVQAVPSQAETRELLAAAAASGGLVSGVVGWVDLTSPAAGAELDELREAPGGHLLVGARHQAEDEPDPEWLVRPDVRRGIAALAGRGLAHDLLVRAPQRPAALALVRELDEVPFVLDHAGKPAIAAGEWEPWASWLAELAGRPNVVCKLSGLVTEAGRGPDGWSADRIAPYVEHALACFGGERLLFGSDWPVCELAATHVRVRELLAQLLSGASDAERAAVFGDNAVRAYRLGSRSTLGER